MVEGQSIVPFILTSTAYLLANLGSYWCNFMLRLDAVTNKTRGIGIWAYEGNVGFCLFYSNVFKADAALRTARASNIIVTCIGFACLMHTFFAGCMPFLRRPFLAMMSAFGLIICCLFSGLTLLVKNSKLCIEDVNMERRGEEYDFEGGCILHYGAK